MKKLLVLSLVLFSSTSMNCLAEDFYGNTTIEDIFNAPSGEKLNSFSKYLNSPDGVRTMGIFMPRYGFDPKTGKVNDPYEERAKYLEEQQYKQKKLEIMQDAFRSIED